MIEVLLSWYRHYLCDREAVILTFVLFFVLGVVLIFGQMLGPVLAGVVIAYVLDGAINILYACRVPRLLGVFIMYLFFLSIVFLLLFGLAPMIWGQISHLINELPSFLMTIQDQLSELPKKYPDVITEAQIYEVVSLARQGLGQIGQLAVSSTMTSIGTLMNVVLYLIVVPLMVFFLLYDRDRILTWCAGFLPKERRLLQHVWSEVNGQLGNYVRGKATEMIIVGGVTYVAFVFLQLNYALLLSVLVGVSVLLPYVGAAVVTVPVALVGFLQFGFGSEFTYLISVYMIIQILDGNLLVPLLFSEVVNLHPVAIIVAISLFGGLWGIWGMFFSIPLAILIKAVLEAWPTQPVQ